MQDPSVVILIIAFTFLLAGMVKGVIGMGLPTVAMGVLGLVMPPVQAAALLVVPSLVTNVWQLVAGPSFIALLRRFATLMVGVCLGTAVGIGLLTGGATALASAALGTVLAAYGAIGLISARFTVSPRSERRLSPIIGLITGVLTGATGVFVIPAVPYFSSLGLEKRCRGSSGAGGQACLIVISIYSSLQIPAYSEKNAGLTLSERFMKQTP